jgi:hypothetical protein
VPLGGEGSYYGDAEAGEDERYTKQQRLEQHGGNAAGGCVCVASHAWDVQPCTFIALPSTVSAAS